MKTIARIKSDFPTKFGIPRQSGLIKELRASIVFEPEYRSKEACRGLEQFSHIWIIWEFSESKKDRWSATVRPPRLGGNTRLGVFATRSPFRPNPIGLSSVKLLGIEEDSRLGPVLHISGADLMDGTPIFDIKPYLPYADSHPEAVGGFSEECRRRLLTVTIPEPAAVMLSDEQHKALIGILQNDPRPSYQNDPARTYGFGFAEFEVKFRVHEDTAEVIDILMKE